MTSSVWSFRMARLSHRRPVVERIALRNTSFLSVKPRTISAPSRNSYSQRAHSAIVLEWCIKWSLGLLRTIKILCHKLSSNTTPCSIKTLNIVGNCCKRRGRPQVVWVWVFKWMIASMFLVIKTIALSTPTLQLMRQIWSASRTSRASSCETSTEWREGQIKNQLMMMVSLISSWNRMGILKSKGSIILSIT